MDKITFPNLARRGEPEQHPDVNAAVCGELTLAGCKAHDFNFKWPGEVPTTMVGFAHRWKFERAWYYYIATGPGIPPDVAEAFDKEWGQQVRASGDCVCRGATFWNEGFATGSYHIDTQEGLNAFVKLLATIHKPRPKEEQHVS